jgi:hypothetical protein
LAIDAIRRLTVENRPHRLHGCEVWRNLDWLLDSDKVLLDVSDHENLQAALLGVFDSQVCGGKRYDLATMGQRQANATYYASDRVDAVTRMSFAMDLTPLIHHPALSARAYVAGYIDRFARDVTSRIERLE